MFKIYCGKNEFYQWDLNQKLMVSDASVTQVHFCNKTDDCSLVVEVYELDGVRVADVPNILLQNDWTIRAYAYNVDHTLIEQRFKVNARTKPTDYVYTETEVKNWDEFVASVNADIAAIEDIADMSNVLSNEAKVNSEIAEANSNTAMEDAESALTIARGANQALTFNDYNECCSWIIDNNVIPGETYPVGNVLLIKTLYVPDLYIYGESEENVDYVPTDEEILDSLNEYGYFDVGSCRLAQMETQKVDLSDYAKKAQVPTITTTLKDNGAYTLTITKGVE